MEVNDWDAGGPRLIAAAYPLSLENSATILPVLAAVVATVLSE